MNKKVELFASDGLDILESKVNEWLKENDVNVLDIDFSASGSIEALKGIEATVDCIYLAMVFYEEKS